MKIQLFCLSICKAPRPIRSLIRLYPQHDAIGTCSSSSSSELCSPWSFLRCLYVLRLEYQPGATEGLMRGCEEHLFILQEHFVHCRILFSSLGTTPVDDRSRRWRLSGYDNIAVRELVTHVLDEKSMYG